MRRLNQPGPAPAKRIIARSGAAETLEFLLQPGQTLNEALTAPLIAAGFSSGALVFSRTELSPFRYYLPGPSPDASHVAWFSGPHAAQRVRVETACVTFGWRDGAPYTHCHAVWTEPDGARRGGHIIPETSRVAAAGQARAWGLRNVLIEVVPDRETNFTLFQPASGYDGPGLIAARLRPNQDVCAAIEELCRERGIRAARIVGSLGSLIGAVFTDGRTVGDHATEVLVLEGEVAAGMARLRLAVADMRGRLHEGVIARAQCPVCITFELFLMPVAA